LISSLLTESTDLPFYGGPLFRKLRLGLRGHRVAVGRDLLEGLQG
jgi:hypothetical protein